MQGGDVGLAVFYEIGKGEGYILSRENLGLYESFEGNQEDRYVQQQSDIETELKTRLIRLCRKRLTENQKVVGSWSAMKPRNLRLKVEVE